MDSILQTKKECLICKTQNQLHLHHVFYGIANRRISDREGLVVWLCPFHHNASNHGVHLNRTLDLKMKKWAQRKWQEKNNKTKENFRTLFGKNYL